MIRQEHMTMGNLVFGCGCKFPIADHDQDIYADHHTGPLPLGIDVDIYNVPHTCPRTWALLAEGHTKGVFQLEGNLGRTWARKIQPENLEELSALIALIRPGCVSGDTKITVRMNDVSNLKRKHSYVKVTMRELYRQFQNQHVSYRGYTISMDETTGLLFSNKITDVISSGQKEVFRVRVRASRKDILPDKFYSLKCTEDHPLLTLDGWKMLKDVQPGERIAAITSMQSSRSTTANKEGEKHFRIRCFQNYIEKCIFCDWNEASLDVNHIVDNRKKNNDVDNLCFMCPNHHRMYTEHKIPVQEVRAAQKANLLPNTDDIQWVEYVEKISCGITDTYDMTVEGPHHNFIAGNMVVHNCLKALSGDPPKSMTQRFKDRKHKLEDIEYLHPALESVLNKTYGVLVYQESAMQLAVTLAGFDLQQADVLRKCIAEGSLIYTQNGPRPIEELCANPNLKPCVLTIDEKNQLVYRPLKKVWCTGVQPTRTLVCEKGYRISLTSNHQVFTQDGWKDMSDIKIDDFVAIPQKYTYKGYQKKLTIEDIIIISYVISEGTHSARETKITNSDPWVLQIVRQALRTKGAITKEYQQANGCTDIYIKQEYKKMLDSILPHAKSRYKIIPNEVLQSMHGLTKAFVGHYFSAEGHVSCLNLEISSTSYKIIIALQALLLRDGVHAGISIHNTKYKGEPYQSYRLYICSALDISKFHNAYKDYICPSKLSRLQHLLKSRENTYSNNRCLVPACFIKAATKNVNLSAVLADPCGSCYNKNQTYDRAHRINQVVQSELLDDILNAGFRFTKVKAITENKEQKTYDYEIDDDKIHYGFVNGILVHNSIGKKRADIMRQVRDEFISGCTTTAIVTQEQAEEIFGWIKESQKYSFNHSHGVSYAIGGYWTAYLKAHFPAQFYCSFLHGAQWKQDTGEEVYELVNDAKLNDIVVRVPDFRDQQTVPYLHGTEVCFGIGDIKNVGAAALQKLRAAVADISKPVAEWSWMDYIVLFSDRVSSTVNEALVCSGALDHYEKPRTTMMYELNLWKELTKKEQEWIAEHGPHENLITALRRCARTKKEGGGCHSVKRVGAVENLVSILEKPPHSLYDTADFIAWCEDKYLGASLTCSRVDGCVKAVEANVTCKDVVKGHTGYTVVAVEVTRVKQVKTKQGKTPGQNMAFMSVADSSCSLDDVVVFPSVWREYQDLLYEGNTVLLQGEPSRKKGGGFTAKKFWQI